MKTYKNLYEQLISEENVEIAIHNALKGKCKKKRKARKYQELKNKDKSILIPEIIDYAKNFKHFEHIKVHIHDGVRQKEILDWLSRNEDIVEDFIILDDEWADLKLLIHKLILTSDANPNRPILGRWYCRDGLRFIHVIKAIKMLGIKNIKRRNNQNEQS